MVAMHIKPNHAPLEGPSTPEQKTYGAFNLQTKARIPHTQPKPHIPQP